MPHIQKCSIFTSIRQQPITTLIQLVFKISQGCDTHAQYIHSSGDSPKLTGTIFYSYTVKLEFAANYCFI